MKMFCRPRNPLRYRHCQKNRIKTFARKTLVETQRKRVTSRNHVPFTHSCSVLQQRLALLYRLQPARSFPGNKVVLGNCWFRFNNSLFLSLLTLPGCSSQNVSARISLSDAMSFTWSSLLMLGNLNWGDRDIADGLYGIWLGVWTVRTTQMHLLLQLKCRQELLSYKFCTLAVWVGG